MKLRHLFTLPLSLLPFTTVHADVFKDNNTDLLDVGSSWVGGFAPTTGDYVVFDDTFAGAGALDAGAAVTWDYLYVEGSTVSSLIDIANTTYGNFISLGLGGLDMSAAPRDLRIAGLDVSASQTWTIAPGRTFSAGSTRFSGSGDVVVSGGGQLVLNGNAGADAYTGTLTITAGGLQLSGALNAANVSVDGATLHTGGSLTGNLALATTVDSVIDSTGSPLAVTGDVSLANQSVINPFANGVPAEGSHPLITFTGTLLTGDETNLSFPAGFVPGNYRQTFALTTDADSIDLTVTGSAESLIWDGSTSTTWDINTATAWTGGGGVFYNADSVLFNDDAASGSVVVAAAVEPNSFTVNNDAVAFDFTGSSAIGGGTSLIKEGDGTLTFGMTVVNGYTGGTLIKGGIVQNTTTSANSALGTGTVTLSAGTLNAAKPASLTNPLVLGDSNSGTAETVVQYTSRATTSGTNYTSLNMPTVVSSAAPDSKAILRFVGTTVGYVGYFTGAITLQNRDLYLDAGGSVIGGVDGKISGIGDIHITKSTGPRLRLLNNNNDFVGDVYVDSGQLQIGPGQNSGTITSIPLGSDLNVTGDARVTGDFVPTVGGLNGSGKISVQNVKGANTTVLTVGNADKSGSYSGIMLDETVVGTLHQLALTKTGTGTQVLSGDCSNTGSTLIEDGVLQIDSAVYASDVTVTAAGTLAGTGTLGSTLTATDPGAVVAPGSPTGTLSVTGTATLNTGGTLAIHIDDAASPTCGSLTAAGTLDITDATLDITVDGTAGQPVYTIASYGTLTGTFATVNGTPDGYTLETNYNSSNKIALVSSSDPYTGWLAPYTAITGADRAPGVDFDGDGLDNGVEFVIGSDPTTFTGPATAGYPKAELTGGNMVFTFKRSTASTGYPVTVETSIDLATWPLVSYPIHTADGTVGQVTVAGEDVTVSIPMAPDAKKFARLKVDIPFTP